ncbi:TON1 Recruiting Motif 19 [Hibiscus trionum]|uniref:TON1 Recruiting Motif 19 n=1 Tax=Hibiscus trionum TaxID=183268 RepID=A0A9W7LHN2_HIBTR|nr:TON1 Recruiting Motif 19 [Hibiscus trionum]
METYGQQRRPKISSFSPDLSFTDFELSSDAPSSRGKRQLRKQRKLPNLAADSTSCLNDTRDKDQLMFDFDWRSSKQSTGTPMKKLLAREMSKENESRKRSSSVIARLMGLDGLPPQQSGHKQQNQTESSQEKVQTGVSFYSPRSSRKSSMEEPEFKDVFEVLDASKMESGGYSSQGTANSKLSNAEVAFIQQKFMEAKLLSTDEKLQDSEEFNDALEVLNSNTDLLLKFLEQPDLLFTKHLHDLQGASPQSHCGRISLLKSSHTLNNDDGRLDRGSGKATRLKHHSKYPQGLQELLSHSYGRYAAHNRTMSHKFQLYEKSGPAVQPTRIVLLKPNPGKSQNSTRTASSPCSSHNFPSDCLGHHPEILGIESREAETWHKKRVHQDIGFSRHNSRELREMAKEITSQIKNSFSNGSMKISTSRVTGYAGDESSCDVSCSESANNLDVLTVSYRDNIGWRKRHRRPSSRRTESSVSREAKKRLSERWKLTHISQEVQMVSKGSTLGEMLAISDREMIPANSSGLVGGEGCSKIGSHAGLKVWNEPLGISSRDGWKDGHLGDLSRSRSVPASVTEFESPRIRSRHGSLRRDKHVIPKEDFKWNRNKAAKGNFNQWEAPLPSNQRSRGESASTAKDSSSVLQNALDINDQNKAVLSKPFQKELSIPPSVNSDVCSGDVNNSQEPSEASSKQVPLHCPVSERGSLAGSKEGDQPSPISVIDAPFTDDFSSGSECFESISAHLHGLRMQLQLLKLETEAYEEGKMLLSSDDDGDQVSAWSAQDKGIAMAEKNLESVYIVDVLVDSGINGADLNTFLATWRSPDCPVNPTVFEELEKKYHNLNSWSRAERRLMFDRINSKLLEIYQPFMDQYPWIKPVRKIIPKWNILELEDSLHKSLVSENKKLDMDAGECEWLNLRGDTDVLGKEIERLLSDELIAEVVQDLVK